MLMSKKVLQDLCKQHSLYRTPSLNDKLYCNFKGFSAISDLGEYVNLKALFLEGNLIESLDGLPELKQLKCLYVHQNCVQSLLGLGGKLDILDTLNISNNNLTSLEGLACCPLLSTLLVTHNQLMTAEGLAELVHLPNLHTLDLQNNMITEPDALKVLYQLPTLKCLYLKGNPVVSTMRNYRKMMIVEISTLTYLDDRPVTDTERRTTLAWFKGGAEAEREERKVCREEVEAADLRNFQYMQSIRKEGWRQRRINAGLPQGEQDPALEGMGSDEEYELDVEPAELVAARSRLAAYTGRPGEEESAEVAEARRHRVRNGLQVSEGSWAANSSDTTRETEQIAEDERIYLDSVKSSQAQLDAHHHSPHSPDVSAHALTPDGVDEDEEEDEGSVISLTSSSTGTSRAAATTGSGSSQTAAAEVEQDKQRQQQSAVDAARVSEEDRLLTKCLGGGAVSAECVVVEVLCSSPEVDFEGLD
ncbi:MAG: hypothetical protein WDW38_002744 [Sanguina aurantia]